MTVYVFGHRNPDTDAICAALTYADLLQRTSRPDAIAASCGPANARTQFVLKQAGVSAPRIVMDVRPETADVCKTDVVTACDDEVFFEVYGKLCDHKLRAIPIVSREGPLIGILSLIDLLELVFHADENDLARSRQVNSSLDKICSAVGGQYQSEFETARRETVQVMVGAMSAGAFTTRLHESPPEELLVVCGDRPTIQVPALERGVRGLVLTGGYELSPGLLQLAKSNGVSVIVSPHDTATTVMRIKAARSIESAIRRSFVSLAGKTPVKEARRRVDRASQFMFPVLDDDGDLVGVISKSDLVDPPKTELILVDHNELAQAVPGAEEAEIIEVLDHHRLGGSLRSAQPIRFVNEPVGSTCTLVARGFRAAGLTPNVVYFSTIGGGISCCSFAFLCVFMNLVLFGRRGCARLG